jgi:hypothetical protein
MQQLAATRPGPLSYQRLNYLKTLLEVALLLFALPWVIRELCRDPIDAGRKIAGAKKPMAA